MVHTLIQPYLHALGFQWTSSLQTGEQARALHSHWEHNAKWWTIIYHHIFTLKLVANQDSMSGITQMWQWDIPEYHKYWLVRHQGSHNWLVCHCCCTLTHSIQQKMRHEVASVDNLWARHLWGGTENRIRKFSVCITREMYKQNSTRI